MSVLPLHHILDRARLSVSLRPSVEIPLKIGDFLDLQTFIFISVENIWKMALKNGVGKIGEWYYGNIVQDYWKIK